MYGYDAYTQITGISVEKPINSDCPYYSAQDFSHLTPTQKKKLLEMLYLLPESIKNVPRSGARATWNEYEKIKADKTGYSYFNTYISKRLPKKWEKEELLEFQKLCLDMLVYGRPEALLKAKSATLERIIYTCRFRHAEDFYRRQKGSKIKEKQFDKTERMIYDREANALVTLGKKYKHSDWVKFGNEMLEKAPPIQVINRETTQTKPANKASSRYTEEDFAGLSPEQKKELLDLMKLLPDRFLHASNMDSATVYKIYTKMQADETGYRYAQNHFHGASSPEKAAKLQKLAMEMVIYRRPLALLHAENYTLEQVIQVCKFNFAESFYRWQQKGNKKLGKTNEMGSTMISLQANALKTLGKKFNHPDWVQFGQEMYVAGQKCEVVRSHDDTPVIQHQTAPKSDQSSVRNQ